MRSPQFQQFRRRACVALFTALTLLAPPVGAAEPAPSSSAEASRFEAARKRYNEDEYLPAAKLFEGLHGDTQNPLYLYYAGLAREGAGHDTHAIRLWQQALQLGLDREFTAKAQTRLEQARARTTAVTVTVVPAALTSGATLELRSATGQRQPIFVPLTELPVHMEPGNWSAKLIPGNPGFQPLEVRFTIARGTQKIAEEFKLKVIEHPVTFEFTPADASLAGVTLVVRDPENLSPERHEAVRSRQLTIPLRLGRWNYTLEVPGQSPQSGSLTVTRGVAAISLALPHASTIDPDPAPAPKWPPHRRLALGLGLGALAPAIAGAVLTGVAIKADPKTDGNLLETALKRRNDFYLGGTSLLAGGVGLWIGTLLASKSISRRGWRATLGVGSAIGIAGLAWNSISYAIKRDPEFDDGNDILTNEQWNSHRGHLIASTALLGLGASLALSATIALVATRSNRNHPSRIAFSVSQSGFSLRF